MSQTLTVNEFSTFLGDQRQQIAAAFTEIEQVQVEYQGAYTRFKADHDKTLHALTDQIEARANGAGNALRPLIEARIPKNKGSSHSRSPTWKSSQSSCKPRLMNCSR